MITYDAVFTQIHRFITVPRKIWLTLRDCIEGILHVKLYSANSSE